MVENHPDHTWPQQMKDLLLEINEAVHKAGGVLKESMRKKYRDRYQDIRHKNLGVFLRKES